MNHFPAPKSLSSTLTVKGSAKMMLDYTGVVTEEPKLEGFEPLSDLADSLEQTMQQARPAWDKARRILVFAGVVIKRFNWPARNQELILTAFEEMGWPERIDDPLPITEGISQKDRLHDTIKCLNRKRLVKSIRFAGDGSGQGICWRRSEEAERSAD
ncbi:MAG: hypothetical protein ACKO81_09970 [Planctomycetota bacterium]